VALSDAGAQLLQRVRPALTEIADAMDAAGALGETPSGTLRLNVADGAGADMLGPVVAEYLRRYPAMSLDIVAEGRLVDIVAEGFDAGFRLLEAVPRDMIAVRCGPDLSYCVVGAPGYFAEHGRPRKPADLLGHECIRKRMPSGAIYRWEFERRGETVALDVKGRLTLGSNALAIAAALAGAGLAFEAEWLVKDHIAAGRLERVLADWTPPFAGLCLYYPGHRHVPAGLRAFTEVMRDMAPSSSARRKRADRSPP
jgi:DNA-binding transcriptional LysR family regulator